MRFLGVLILTIFATLFSYTATFAACPVKLSGIYLGITEIDYFSSTDMSSATFVGKAKVRVQLIVSSSTQNNKTTVGTFTANNTYGITSNKNGGTKQTTATYSYDNSTCLGSYLTNDGETYVFIITDSGSSISANLKSWTDPVVVYPHSSIISLRKP